jgi:hypothetical protein
MKIDKKRLIEIINEEMEMMNPNHSRGTQMQNPDKEGKMAMSQLEDIAKYAMSLHQMLEPYGENLQLESWIQSKLTLARDYISKVKHFLDHELNQSNDLGIKE